MNYVQMYFIYNNINNYILQINLKILKLYQIN